MKIHVFVVIDESFRYGDLESSKKYYFISKELQDDYFEFLRKDFIENQDMIEYEKNSFEHKSGNSKWAYYIDKFEENLEIIETKNWK